MLRKNIKKTEAKTSDAKQAVSGQLSSLVRTVKAEPTLGETLAKPAAKTGIEPLKTSASLTDAIKKINELIASK